MLNLKAQNQNFISVICLSSDLKKDFWIDQIISLIAYLNDHYVDFEVIIVEANGNFLSSEEIKLKLQDTQFIRFLKSHATISKNEAYILALSCCIGDYAIFFNPRTDSLNLIKDTIEFCTTRNKDIIFSYRKSLFDDAIFCFSRKGILAILSVSIFNYSIMKRAKMAKKASLVEFRAIELKRKRILIKSCRMIMGRISFRKRRPAFFSAEEICSPQMINLSRVNITGNFEL